MLQHLRFSQSWISNHEEMDIRPLATIHIVIFFLIFSSYLDVIVTFILRSVVSTSKETENEACFYGLMAID